MGGFPFELEADFLEEGVGLGGVLGFALGDEALDDGGAGFAFAGLEVFPGDPFGGEAGVMGGELRVEVGFGGGEVLEAVGGFAFAVVGDGVEEAEADYVIPLAVAPELGNQVMNLELLPAKLNRSKSDKVTERAKVFAKELYEAGLLSEEGFKSVKNRDDVP
ncbi:hypothetical protein EBX31_12425 [bacterium]|nr:hypothetical protein [bacterium]